MAYIPKVWHDVPSTLTPISAASLADLETRLAAYTDVEAVRATNAENTKAPTANPTFTGTVISPVFSGQVFTSTGLTGAVAASRYVGGITGSTPITGTFNKGDFAISQLGGMAVCVAPGSPGNWSFTSSSVFTLPGNIVLSSAGSSVLINILATAPSGGDDLAALQPLLVSGVHLILRSNSVYNFSAPLNVPDFAQVEGGGASTLCRATGNNYIFSFNPGNQSRISNLAVDALTKQSSGGAFDYTNAADNIALDNIYFNNNNNIGLNITPSSGTSGIYTFDRLRWNGGTGMFTAIVIGDNVNAVSDLLFTRCWGTSADDSNVSLTTWVKTNSNTDTVHFSDCLFLGGIGPGISWGATTNGKLRNVTVDSHVEGNGGVGIVVNGPRELVLEECTVSSRLAGVWHIAGGLRISGGLIQNCGLDGVDIFAGSNFTNIHGLTVADCNQNNVVGHGISVATGTTEFTIQDCRIGNFTNLNGNINNGILIAGSCDYYVVTGNRLHGCTVAGISDGGTGIHSLVIDNLDENIIPFKQTLTPEAYGALGDVAVFNDGAMTAGSSTITSTQFTTGSLPGGAGSKNIYVWGAGLSTPGGVTSGSLTLGGAVTSIPRTTGAAISAGPIVLVSGSHVQFFATAGASVNSNIPVNSQLANFSYPNGTAISYNITGLSTKVQSVGTHTATLLATPSQTVAGVVGWFGTDDSTALVAWMAALVAGGSGVLSPSKGYLADSAPLTSGQGNAILPFPNSTNIGVTIKISGSPGFTPGAVPFLSNGEIAGSSIYTTRQGDIFSTPNGPPSILGGPTDEGLAGSSNGWPTVGHVWLEDFNIVKPENPSIGSIDALYCANLTVRNFRSKTPVQMMSYGSYGSAGIQPTHFNSFGIRAPNATNSGAAILDNTGVYGDYMPYVLASHTEVRESFAQFCYGSIGFQTAGSYTNELVKFGIFDCVRGPAGWNPQTGVQSLALGKAVYLDGLINWEVYPNGAWGLQDTGTDVNGQIRGKIKSLSNTLFKVSPTAVPNSPTIIYKDVDPTIVAKSYIDEQLSESNFIAVAPLDELTGTAARDLAGGGNPGTYSGAFLGVPDPLAIRKVHLSSLFSSHITFTTMGSLGANIGSSTIEIIFQWLGTNQQQYILGTKNVTTGTGIAIRTNTDNTDSSSAGKTCFQLWDQTLAHHRHGHISPPVALTDAGIYDGQPHHICWQPSTTGTHVVYVDGVQQTVTMEASPGTLGTLANFSTTLAVGALNTGGVFSGYLDASLAGFGVYTTTLTQARLFAHVTGLRRNLF